MSWAATGTMASFLYIIRICYRSGCCDNGTEAGVWGLALHTDVSNSVWNTGFRLNTKTEFVIAAATASWSLVVVCGL